MIKMLLGAAAMATVAYSVVPVQAAKMSGGGCSGANLAKTETMIETMADGKSKRTAQKEISAAQAAMLSGKMGACGMHLSKAMRQRAPQPRWRRLATPVRDDFHWVQQAQRKSGSLKLHEVMTKPDREPVPSFGARTSYEIQVAPPPVIEPKPEPIIGAAPVDPSADIVQVPPPPVIEPKAEPITATAPADLSADVAQVTSLPVIEHKPVPITRSHNAPTVVMVMVALVAFSVLGLIEFLFRPTYAKRVLVFGAMSRSQRAPDYVRNLSSRPLNQVEADPAGAPAHRDKAIPEPVQ